MADKAISDIDTKEWMYIDNNGNTKGPVPASLILKLLDKGMVISGSNFVWKSDMSEWKKLSEVEPFQQAYALQNTQWFYVDQDKATKGPVITRMILHKVKMGDIDGMTLVFNKELGEWKAISDVPELKAAIIKQDMDEEVAELAIQELAKRANAEKAQDIQVFVDFDEGPSPALAYAAMMEERMKEQMKAEESNCSSSSDATGLGQKHDRRAFTADNGVRYCWDDDENDWVEDDRLSEDEDEMNEPKDGDDNDDDADETEVANEMNTSASAGQSGVSGTAALDGDAVGAAPKRKRNKKKKNKKVTNYWVYITGLPTDIDIDEIKAHFSKAGLIAISPLDQLPKIKLYKGEDGRPKGDASLCYNAEESVKMAVEIFSGGYIRPTHKITVTRAEFQQREGGSGGGGGGDGAGTGKAAGAPAGAPGGNGKRARVSHAQVKVAQSAMRQALSWNEDDDIGVSGKQALKIVVMEGMFSPEDFNDSSFSDELEADIAEGCGRCGDIDKITVFSKNPRGVAIVKFTTSFASQVCIKMMDGRFFGGRKIRCYFWDGVTNFTSEGSLTLQKMEEEEKEEKERLDEFGDWLERGQSELPPELRLRVEH